MKQLFKMEDLPVEYQKEVKNWVGVVFEFITGRIDEHNTAVTVWESGGTYKIIRLFVMSGKNEPAVSVDYDMLNFHQVMEKLLMRY